MKFHASLSTWYSALSTNLGRKSMNRRIAPVALSLVVAICGMLGSAGLAALTRPSAASGMSLSALGPMAPFAPVGTGFTFEGRLTDSLGNPANGAHDFTFKLFDASAGGVQFGPTITLTNQTVTGGIFNVTLDFGISSFFGDARWLEIAAAPAGDPLVTLSPRTPLEVTPYALSAPWFGTSGKPFNYSQLLAPNTFTTADSTGDVGRYSSVTIGSDGLPLISYQDTTNLDLQVAHCNDLTCSTRTITPLDTAGSVGYYTSITVGTDGLGLISYYDGTNDHLKVAHCSNVNCTAATLSTIDPNPLAGEYTSITINTTGFGAISYYEQTNNDLKIALCADTNCTTATLRVLDSAGDVGRYTSIAIGDTSQFGTAFPIVAYEDTTNNRLKLARCLNVSCSSSGSTTLDLTTTMGTDTSVAMGRDGLPIISYQDGTNADLKVAHCNNLTCTSAALHTLDSLNSVGSN